MAGRDVHRPQLALAVALIRLRHTISCSTKRVMAEFSVSPTVGGGHDTTTICVNPAGVVEDFEPGNTPLRDVTCSVITHQMDVPCWSCCFQR